MCILNTIKRILIKVGKVINSTYDLQLCEFEPKTAKETFLKFLKQFNGSIDIFYYSLGTYLHRYLSCNYEKILCVLSCLKFDIFIKSNPMHFFFSLTIKGVRCLIDEELSVSKQSHQLIKKMAKIRSRNNQIYIFTEPTVSILKEMLDVKTDSLKLRVLEMMVDICTISHEHTQM